MFTPRNCHGGRRGNRWRYKGKIALCTGVMLEDSGGIMGLCALPFSNNAGFVLLYKMRPRYDGHIFICICLNRSKPAPFFFCPSLQSLYFAMTRGRAVCWQARCQRECASPSQVGSVEPFLPACSDAPLANAIPPKFERPRLSTHCLVGA